MNLSIVRFQLRSGIIPFPKTERTKAGAFRDAHRCHHLRIFISPNDSALIITKITQLSFVRSVLLNGIT